MKPVADFKFGFNARGCWTLFAKESWRFLKVWGQTIVTPMITVLLYLLVFAQVLESRIVESLSVKYTVFLVPGLVMMSIIQNAFANASSSLIQSKMNGSLTFLLLAPISAVEMWLAYMGAAICRGLFVGSGVLLIATLTVDGFSLHAAQWLLPFAVLGGAVLGVLGLIAGIISQKFDHISAFQNFVILPLSFLSGVFYSVQALPPTWEFISRLNPFFYMIDGFRYGFLGVSDANPWLSLAIVAGFWLLVSSLALLMLSRGYRLRH